MSNVVIFRNKELHGTRNFVEARVLWSAGDIYYFEVIFLNRYILHDENEN